MVRIKSPRAYRITPATILIGISIILSSSFTRQLVDYAKAHIGKRGFAVLMQVILGVVALAFVIFRSRKRTSMRTTVLFVIVFTVGLMMNLRIKNVVEQVHLFEYGVLGWYACRDLIRGQRKAAGIALAILVCVLAGISDELFQLFIPGRYCAVSDMMLNAMGGIWGVCLYLGSR